MNQTQPSPQEILYTIWNNCMEHISHSEKDWEPFLQLLFSYEISMEENMQYLHLGKPDFASYLNWIKEQTKSSKTFEITDSENVFSEEDILFWKENGYIILKNAISSADAIATQEAIAEFLNIQLNDYNSWYEDHPAKEGLMVLFTNHPTLEKNRASLKIKKAYEQLYGHTQLYKTIDKVSFNPPETGNYTFKGSPLHWDTSLVLPIPYRLQGLLYLTDVPAHGGAFQCVPGFQHTIANWLETIPPEADPRTIAINSLQPKTIPGNAGDFIIWHQALPHGATPNQHKDPRMVQYLTYLPTNHTDEEREWK